MPLTFEERQEIARKAVATRRARLAAAGNGNNDYFDLVKAKREQEREAAKNKPEGWQSWGPGKKAAWTRTHKEIDTDEILAEALDALTQKRGDVVLDRDEKKALLAYQRLADLAEGTIVSYYDQGSRFAKLVEAGKEWVTLLSIPAYKKTARQFKVRTVNVVPVEN